MNWLGHYLNELLDELDLSLTWDIRGLLENQPFSRIPISIPNATYITYIVNTIIHFLSYKKKKPITLYNIFTYEHL